MNIVLQEKPNEFFEKMENFLQQSVFEVMAEMPYPNRNSLKIYIPEYIISMYEHYRFNHNPSGDLRILGIEVIHNYENSIVVCHKDALLYNKPSAIKRMTF